MFNLMFIPDSDDRHVMACHDIQHCCDRKKSEVGTVGPCCRGCGEPAPAMKENNRMKSDRFKQRIDKLNQINISIVNV